MADVFISYARADIPKARRLASLLEDSELTVWWDPHIPPGDVPHEVIRRELDAASCVVVLWSTSSTKSRWVYAEADIARKRGVLIPALLDHVEELPIPFGTIQCHDLMSWPDDSSDPAIRALIARIRTMIRDLSLQYHFAPNRRSASLTETLRRTLHSHIFGRTSIARRAVLPLLGAGMTAAALGLGVRWFLARPTPATTSPITITPQQPPYMPNPHSAGGTILLDNGTVLVTTGSTDYGLTPKSDLFDPLLQRWTSTGSVNEARALWGNAIVRMNDGKIMIAGGEGPRSSDLPSVELYDSRSGTWHYGSPLNTPRRNHAIVALRDGKILVTGGAHGPPDNNRYLASTEIYDPLDGHWRYSGNLNVPREGTPRLVLLNDDRVMLAGGYTRGDHLIDKAELYDPHVGRWTPIQMPYQSIASSMTVLQDGKVVIVGGSVGNTGWPVSDLVVSEGGVLYDPAHNVWTYTASMHEARSAHSAIALPEDKLLVAGGHSKRGETLTSIEIYEPLKNRWLHIGELQYGRSDAGIVRLKNGDIFLAGGGGGTVASFTAEIISRSEVS